MKYLKEARNFFLKRRLFISANYDDGFYRLLPMLIMLKADLDNESKRRLPNLCVYAPFPKKIQKILGKSLSAEDWHTALKRKWIHVISRKNFYEKAWRNRESIWFKEYLPEYDNVSAINSHHSILSDDYFKENEVKAKRICQDVITRRGTEATEDFAIFLQQLNDSTRNVSRHYLSPFSEIRDRCCSEKGYDGKKAVTMLFQYFLNDFKQAGDQNLEYTDLLFPPIYIDIARHIMGFDLKTASMEPLPMALFQGSQIEEYILAQEDKLRNAAFFESAIETLSKLAETGAPVEVLSRDARLEERVEFFAAHYRDAVWLLIWLLAKLSKFALSGVQLNPHTYTWREMYFAKGLDCIFSKSKRAKWVLTLSAILSHVPGADKLGILKILSLWGKGITIQNFKPHVLLTNILSQTGVFVGDLKTNVYERAKEIWKEVSRGLSESEISMILNSSNKWANFFVGMEQVRLTRVESEVYRNDLWRSLKNM